VRELKKEPLLAVGCGALLVLWAVVRVETALYGDWTNEVFGVRFWQHSDPFGWYLGSALALGDADNPVLCFPGHSGLVLSWCLWAIGHGAHLLAGSADYATYVARELATILYVAQLGVVVVHLGSAALLYQIVKIWMQDESVASAGAIAFMLAWPTQFYLVRPAPEATAAFLLLLSVWCWSRFEQRHRTAQSGSGFGWAFLGGAASVLAAQEKVFVMSPLPVLLGAMYATVPACSHTVRVQVAGAFVLGGVVAGATTFAFVDWRWVASFWSFLTEGDTGRHYFHRGVNALRTSPNLLVSLAVMAPAWIAGVFGARLAWRRREARRLVVLLGLAVATTTVGAVGRGSFHYWLVHAIVAAAFCGVVVVHLAARASAPARIWAVALLLAAVHAPVLAASVSLHRSDRRHYDRWRAWVAAIDDDRPIEIHGGDCRTFGIFFPDSHPFHRNAHSEVGDRFCGRFVDGPPAGTDAASRLVHGRGGWALQP
jgi:hypothetical protein